MAIMGGRWAVGGGGRWAVGGGGDLSHNRDREKTW